ncbi:hypothetical protein CYMTET_34264 [Cymbomonas tetramitiformis]|uniref:Uncharacterized protein n=1 Tax=Cymbomonas tetramitiformis TaxID=36881 RepID=A0AAE0FBK9_9CHLO|nr:hypothetical protein CYMTET_34264 [Cymbomonas tetramitiformis]
MNLVEDKKRNRMHWDNVEAWMYIIHNAKQVEQRTDVDYDMEVIDWTGGNEDNCAWVDAWQPAEGPEQVASRVAAGTRRAGRIAEVQAARIVPAADPVGETTTSSGRVVRRPALLEL